MSADPFDSITSQVDEFGPMAFQTDSVGYTLAPPATRATARFGVRRPKSNTYESIIYSQAPVAPTDPTRITARQACSRGSCSRGSMTKDVLESHTVLSGHCREPVRGPGQPEWVAAYEKRDELQQLLIDSEARDQLIAQAYKDIINQNSQLESKPVLCKALARLYQHGAQTPLRPSPYWSDEDWQVAQWYCKNCHPFVTASGSMVFTDRPLVPKKWIDNAIKNLGPVYNFTNSKCMNNACDCASPKKTFFYDETCQPNLAGTPSAGRREANLFPRLNQVPQLPRVLQQQVCDDKNLTARPESMKSFYSLLEQGANGDAKLKNQANLVAAERKKMSDNNRDYSERLYQARVADFRQTSSFNQLRQTAFMDSVPSLHASPLDQ